MARLGALTKRERLAWRLNTARQTLAEGQSALEHSRDHRARRHIANAIAGTIDRIEALEKQIEEIDSTETRA
jgi:hypothetical protein